MTVSDYYGELMTTRDSTTRWVCWFLYMLLFSFIVFELMVGLSTANNDEENESVKSRIKMAQILTVISWCTYPAVYLFAMVGVLDAQPEACERGSNASLADLQQSSSKSPALSCDGGFTDAGFDLRDAVITVGPTCVATRGR